MSKVVLMNENIKPSPLQLVEMHEYPTVRDVDLGATLGMKRPTNIRKLIEKSREELEQYGSLHAANAMIEAGKGAQREVVEYHLSEEQALTICQLSRAPNAPDARRMLIEVFCSYRRGHLVPELDPKTVGGIAKSANEKQKRQLVEYFDRKFTEQETRMQAWFSSMSSGSSKYAALADPTLCVTKDHLSVYEVLEDAGVPTKGRKGFAYSVLSKVKNFSLQRGRAGTRDMSKGNRWVFHRDVWSEWLLNGGAAYISDQKHKVLSRLSGQGYLGLGE